MGERGKLLSEDELDEISSNDLAPDEVDRLVANARLLREAVQVARRLPNVCACPEDRVQASCVYCAMRALLAKIEDADA